LEWYSYTKTTKIATTTTITITTTTTTTIEGRRHDDGDRLARAPTYRTPL
jgi:hypothetical protein